MKNINEETNEMINSLAREIAKAITHANANFDRTFISVVKKANSNGTYEVLDEYGNIRTCVLALPNVTLSEGERVYITIPCGNLNKIFISGIYPQINKR